MKLPLPLLLLLSSSFTSCILAQFDLLPLMLSSKLMTMKDLVENAKKDSSEETLQHITIPHHKMPAPLDPKALGKSGGTLMQKIYSFIDMANNAFTSAMDKIEKHSFGEEKPSVHDVGDIFSSIKKEFKSEESGEKDVAGKVFGIFDGVSSLIGGAGSKQLKGKHVCIREKNTQLNSSLEEDSFATEKTCFRYAQAIKCVETFESSEGTKKTERIEECCEGWTTEDIKEEGCDQELKLQSLDDELDELGFGPAASAKMGLQNFAADAEQYTFLIPVLEDENSTIPATMPFVLPGRQKDFDWSNAQMLTSSFDDNIYVQQNSSSIFVSRPLATSLNCVRIVNANIATEKGIIHLLEKKISSASESILQALEFEGKYGTFISLLPEETLARLNDSAAPSMTVFAIPDDVFYNMTESARRQVDSRSACVKHTLLKQVFGGFRCLADVEFDGFRTLDGAYHISGACGDAACTLGGATLVEGDFVAKNGVFHVVDGFVDAEAVLNWRDRLSAAQNEALASLPDEHELTIFVPDADNFTRFEAEDAASDGKLLDFDDTGLIRTLSNKTVFYGRTNVASANLADFSFFDPHPVLRIGCSTVRPQSTETCSAKVFYVDKPIRPASQTLLDFVRSSERLTKFAEIVNVAAMDGELSNQDVPLTIFAPSDDAFSNNAVKKVLSEPTKCSLFVKQHTVKGAVCLPDLAADLSDYIPSSYVSLSKDNIRPTGDEAELRINDVSFAEREIVLSDGVLYIMDEILTFPAKESTSSSTHNSATSTFSHLPNPFDLFTLMAGKRS